VSKGKSSRHEAKEDILDRGRETIGVLWIYLYNISISSLVLRMGGMPITNKEWGKASI